MLSKNELFDALKQREAAVVEIFNREEYRKGFQPEPLCQAVYSYLLRPAKRFRPGVLLFSCGAVGGREETARLAAAAVEVYHTWTLVHDDIIDNDPKRRGMPTVHEEFRLKALDWGYPPKEAADLGRNIAILAGDLQHAWSVRLLLDTAKLGVPAEVVLDLIHRLEVDLTNGLVEGEALDVMFAKREIEDLTEAEILRMLELKTGVLYEYAGMAGAAIGLKQTAAENPLIEAIGRFARRCGTAFQLQDDILGITGDEKLLGKAVGSDIREGKRTTIVLHAFANAGPQEQRFLKEHLGNPASSAVDLAKVKNLLVEYNGIEHTRKLAETIVDQAMAEIEPLPDTIYKQLLLTWSQFVVNREF
ncbi:MAG TPA: polyprenyl synthetase family protein [Bacillota bacterium]|nr:polyprenyl synthetase family protein [Bacillota bacterium]